MSANVRVQVLCRHKFPAWLDKPPGISGLHSAMVSFRCQLDWTGLTNTQRTGNVLFLAVAESVCKGGRCVSWWTE